MQKTILFLISMRIIFHVSGENNSDAKEELRNWLLSGKDFVAFDADGQMHQENSDLASAILKIFGYGYDRGIFAGKSSKELLGITPQTGIKVSQRDVCPFGADPLILSGEYAYCKSSTAGECPLGFLCDQSFVLGRSICCQDLRDRPNGNTGQVTNNPHIKTTTVRTDKQWPIHVSNNRIPWYIKDRNILATSLATPPPTKITTIAPTSGFTERSQTRKEEWTLLVGRRTKPANPWMKLLTTPSPASLSANITVLQHGSLKSLDDSQSEIASTITLVTDGTLHILVDTGSPSDADHLLRSIAGEHIELNDISMVVITTAHPSYMGNLNFFGQKPLLFDLMEYVGNHFMLTELKNRPFRRISPNVRIWKTPGHTQHDLSVIVNDVPGYGTVSIVGNLIPTEDFLSKKIDVTFEDGVWDMAIKRQNANLIVCISDWIVPGHEKPFKVKPDYRSEAGCSRMLTEKMNFGLNR